MITEVADRVYRLGAVLVNWFIVEDGGKLTLVDAGNPNQYDQLPSAVSELGLGLDDIEAIVLTHAHGDHLGSSARITNASGAAVHVHHDDVALARGESHREFERHFVCDLHHAHSGKSLVFFQRCGALKAPPVHELVEFDHGETIDLAGRPRVIATPGHTDGSNRPRIGRPQDPIHGRRTCDPQHRHGRRNAADHARLVHQGQHPLSQLVERTEGIISRSDSSRPRRTPEWQRRRCRRRRIEDRRELNQRISHERRDIAHERSTTWRRLVACV
jgi:hypothetical protein